MEDKSRWFAGEAVDHACWAVVLKRTAQVVALHSQVEDLLEGTTSRCCLPMPRHLSCWVVVESKDRSEAALD